MPTGLTPQAGLTSRARLMPLAVLMSLAVLTPQAGLMPFVVLKLLGAVMERTSATEQPGLSCGSRRGFGAATRMRLIPARLTRRTLLVQRC